MSEGPLLPKVGKSLDGALELLRWCRQHPQDSGIALRLRELQQALSGLALALDYEMDGQTEKATVALQGGEWLTNPTATPRPSPQGTPAQAPSEPGAVVYDRDLLLDAALDASRLLSRVLSTYRDDAEFVSAVNETIRRIYTIDASRAHDG